MNSRDRDYAGGIVENGKITIVRHNLSIGEALEWMDTKSQLLRNPNACCIILRYPNSRSTDFTSDFTG